MQAFAALSMLGVGLVTLVVGVRLLLLARRTGGLPELGFGLSFVGGSLGTALAQVGMRLVWNEPGPLATFMNGLCFALVAASTPLLVLVTARIFRPGRAWARALVWAGAGASCIAWVLRAAFGDFATANVESPGILLFHSARALIFVWVGFEALHHWSQLRRRLRLGLADPVATFQILMWGISGMAMVGSSLTILYCIFVARTHPLEMGGATALLTLLSALTSLWMWWAFFPPERLRRRLAAPAAEAEAG